ncbi:hypothetical protein [uncultured Oscillibacter sp.]|uniref:hypothetical protein n=1 Tax=uncultured Oscillibacter sp. TaxID=876091 RepID=UPI002612A7A2|nr:hypothetical protein [uncultured Oscillibacter sp.]
MKRSYFESLTRAARWRLPPDEAQEVLEDYAALLDARVAEIVPGPEGTEVVLTEVAPEELVRFNEAHDAFMEAEQSMGPAMGGRYGPI